jgi:DNA replication protein DnaC
MPLHTRTFAEKHIMEIIMKLKDKVIESLDTLKLSGLKKALVLQLEGVDKRSFLSRLDDLLSHELIDTGNRRITTLIRQAKLRWPHADIDGISYIEREALKQEYINELAELHWVTNHQNLLITGSTGCGKTYIACGLAMRALMQQIPVLFIRYNDLLLQLAAAENEERIKAFYRKLNRIPVLIIDDWGISPLNVQQRHLLFEFIECRDQKASLLITSQYPVGDWYDAFGDKTVADSVLDRIIHCAHPVNAQGPSMRELLGLKGGQHE